MTHNMVDLSVYQGDITPQEITALKAAGVGAVYVKATQGGGTNGYQNPDAPQQTKALRDAGFHVGLYHFLTPDDTSSSQAQFFLVTAAALGGSDLPLAIDSETAGPSWPALANDMVAMAMQIESEPSVVRCPLAMFYVNLNYYGNLPGFPWGRLVWLADPNPGAPHKPCLVLQSAPRPEGGFSSIDPDVFLGTEVQWQAFISSGEAPVPPKPPDPVPTPPAPGDFDMATLPTLNSSSPPGSNVTKSVQALLRDKFNQALGPPDGNFGVQTVQAVKNVQAFFKLAVDGVVGQATWAVLLTA
jgi:hypothetical protein